MATTCENRYKLLKVDNNDALSSKLTSDLAKYGCDIRLASDKKQSLEAAKSFRPDLVLLDIQLGEENGLELVPQLREILPDARIVILTSHGSLESATWAIKAGANDYLIKPGDSGLIFDIMIDAKAEEAVSDVVSNPYELRSIYVMDTLSSEKFNVSRTAKRLQIQRRSLQRFLSRQRSRTAYADKCLNNEAI